jgi:hypothetical protein
MCANKSAPPQPDRGKASSHRAEAPIADMREHFARKGPQTAEDSARARDFIEGKISMVRADPNLTTAEKKAAIADLKARR